MTEPEINACCQDPKNRTEPEKVNDDLTVQHCQACGRRHFEISVDPAVLGITVT